MIPFFAAEKTLGKLAKWLRLLGFDTRSNSVNAHSANSKAIFAL
jgi:uncharacterized protein with PIN domain